MMGLAKLRLEAMTSDPTLPPSFRSQCRAEADAIELPPVDQAKYEMALAEIEAYLARQEGAIQ